MATLWNWYQYVPISLNIYGKAYSSRPGNKLILCSKDELKALNECFRGPHPKCNKLTVTNNQNHPYTQKVLEVCQDIHAIWKKQKLVQDSMKYWEIKLQLYYISRYQNTLQKMRYLNIFKKPPNWFLELENMKSLW